MKRAQKLQEWTVENCFYILLFLAVLLLEFRFYYRTSDDKQLLTDFLGAYGSVSPVHVGAWVVKKLAEDVRGWSSRVVINCFANFFVFFMPLWAIGNALVTVLLLVEISRLFRVDQMRERMLVLCLMLLVPIEIYRSCGWIVGTVSYYWPVVFGITAFSLLYRGTWKTSKWAVAAMFCCAVYACNEEIICIAALFGLWIWYVLRREDRRMTLSLLAITVAELLWILFCPGNRNRYGKEPDRWFPRFDSLSVIHRMEMGFTSTMNRFWLRACPVSAALGIVLLALAFTRKRKAGFRVLASLPLVFSLIGWQIQEHASSSRICYLLYHTEGQYGVAGLFDYTDPLRYLPLVFYICIGGLILVLIMDLGDYRPSAVAVSLFLLAVTASRCIMGFTPTIWVSARRTFSLMYWVLVLLIIYMLRQVRAEDREKKIYPLCLTGVGLCACYALMDLMALL